MLLHKSVEHDSRVRREARALVESGHEVIVLELAAVPPGNATIEGAARRSVLPAPWVRRRLPSLLYRLVFLASFVRAVVRVRPDVVHAHDAAMLVPGLIGARLAGARLVYDSHELATSVPYRERWWAGLVAAVEHVAVPRAAAVITVSDGIADRLRQRYRLAKRPVVVRNVTALTPPREGDVGGLRSRLGLDGARVVLHQGAAAPGRGCDELVGALALLPGDVRLVFLGDGEPGYGERLAALADRLGVRDRVHFAPSVPLERLLAHTREADVGVTLLQDTCENHRLALPNKLFEYVMGGIPVVASDLPELGAIVRSYGIGWTADPSDPEQVAAAIAVALRDGSDPAVRDALARAAAELCWPVERERLCALYAALAAATPSRAPGR
jgi:glycosyltransferase involved in cell wall biosynthesis